MAVTAKSILTWGYYKLSAFPNLRTKTMHIVRKYVAEPYLKYCLKKYYTKHTPTPEQQEVLDYIEEKGFGFIPYNWADEIRNEVSNIEVFFDDKLKLPYVLLEGKRLYFPHEWNKEKIQTYYNSVQRIEQETVKSPHRYLTDNFDVDSTDIIVDCGAAEGNFALSVIERVKKVYLFEPGSIWEKPLLATFEPYSDKVELVQKYVSSVSDETSISLDDYFKNKESPTFIKMDVGGFEPSILRGSNRILSLDTCKKVVACTYHFAEDENELTRILESHGFQVSPSYGYNDSVIGNPPPSIS